MKVWGLESSVCLEVCYRRGRVNTYACSSGGALPACECKSVEEVCVDLEL